MAPPLFYAALRGRVDACEQLLQLGAQSNVRVSLCFPEHPLCAPGGGGLKMAVAAVVGGGHASADVMSSPSDSAAGSRVAAAVASSTPLSPTSTVDSDVPVARPFSALDVATWNAERAVRSIV